ncbi:hypothetical protein BH23ACT9_BH23ACT9_21480 [soil metagenome]
MDRSAREAVEAHVAALNHGDLHEVLNTFTADAVFTSDGGTANGRSELAVLFDGVVGEVRPITILRTATAGTVGRAGATVECLLTRRFTITDELGRVAAAHDVEVRAVFTVTHGAISRIDVDPAA